MMRAIAVGVVLAGNLLALSAFPKPGVRAPMSAVRVSAAPCARALPAPAAPDTTLPKRYLLLVFSLLAVDVGVLTLYLALRKGAPAQA